MSTMTATTTTATSHRGRWALTTKNGCAAASTSRRASSSRYLTRNEKKRGESASRFNAVSDGGLDAAAEAAAQRERDVAAKWAGSSVVREARQKGRARSGRGASSSTSTPTGDEVFDRGESSGTRVKGSSAIEGDGDDEDVDIDFASIGESCLLADGIWEKLREEAKADLEREPSLASYLYSTILAHKSIEDVLAFVLANKLRNNVLLDSQLLELFSSQYKKHPDLSRMCLADMQAVFERDPACDRYLAIVLFFKGFQAIQAQRVAHSLWLEDRKALSFLLQNRISEVFHVDIHPGAVLGQGMMMDHATGVVIGETAVVGENVSILHGVTLGGTGTSKGDRHPKIGDGVVIGANVTILGNIKVGADTKIGAGSVVLDEIPPGSTAVGIPAKVINRAGAAPQQPSLSMDQTSYIEDYFI